MSDELHARFDRIEQMLGIVFRSIRILSRGHAHMGNKVIEALSKQAADALEDLKTVATYRDDDDVALGKLQDQFSALSGGLKDIIKAHEARRSAGDGDKPAGSGDAGGKVDGDSGKADTGAPVPPGPAAQPVSVLVAGPTTPGTTVIPISAGAAAILADVHSTATAADATIKLPITGPGVAIGTTLDGVDLGTAGGSPTLTLSQPTTVGHVGNETLTVAPAA